MSTESRLSLRIPRWKSLSDSERLPNWATDFGPLYEYVIEAHGRAANIPKAGEAGSSVHIGIIDSAAELPAHLTENLDVREGAEHSFIDSSKAETTYHCTPVFTLASRYCPGATFSLYQAVREDRKLPLAAFSDAITAAIDDGIDILNISAGEPWPDLVETNPAVLETKRAIEEDVIVVASAGNEDPEDDERLPVHCPAALQDVIAVGGFVSRCPARPGAEPATEPTGPYYVESDDIDDRARYGPFCGERGCIDGEACIPNKTERPWEHNVMPTGEKPDVLAPAVVPELDSDSGPYFNGGTSFAAPIVTGALGGILDELRSENRDLNPYQARRAVVNGSSPIDEGTIPKFDAMGTRRVLELG